MRHISDVPDPMPSHRQGWFALHHQDVSALNATGAAAWAHHPIAPCWAQSSPEPSIATSRQGVVFTACASPQALRWGSGWPSA